MSILEVRSLTPVLDRPDAGVEGRRGARIGPMATTNSCGEMDLGPRRVGIHFRKLACRSDAVDEVLTEGRVNGLDFGARARSTGPPHEGEPARPGRARVLYRRSFWLGRLRRYRVCRRATAGQSRFSTNTRGLVLARRSNEAMKLTRGGWRRGVPWSSAVISGVRLSS
jgi:hypothetical protein